MKQITFIGIAGLFALMISISGCANMTNPEQRAVSGAAIGGTFGGPIGAGIGALTGYIVSDVKDETKTK